MEFECRPASTHKTRPCDGQRPPKVMLKEGSIGRHSNHQGFANARASFLRAILINGQWWGIIAPVITTALWGAIDQSVRLTN